jgi:uncharacterized protein (DUF433 family)
LIDWTKCPAIECVPGRLSGQPVIRDSRVPPEVLVDNRAEGIKWLAENYYIPPATIREVLAFYDTQTRKRPGGG